MVSVKHSTEIYFLLSAITNCVSSSNAEPKAISKNRAKSFSDEREAPSV